MQNHQSSSKRQFRMVQRILSVGGFSLLAGLFGLGLTWLLVGIISAARSKTDNQFFEFAARSMPILIAGGIVGFVIGLAVSLRTARAGPRAQVEFDRKYVGPGGRWRIYFGLPLFVCVLLTPLFKRLPPLFGEKYFIYVALGIVLAVVSMSMVLYGRIPKRFVVPIGIICWMLTLLLTALLFICGPGSS